jgi:NADPH:quinone reductase-like Zn-dependent oxidoreductase
MLLDQRLFATLATISEQRCVKLPDDLGLDYGASMPVVYTTSLHALLNIGGLVRGQVVALLKPRTINTINAHYLQSILIHSACGGVGIASIQPAKMVEADIYDCQQR